MVKNLPSVERSTKIRFGKHVPDSNDQEENTIVFNASNVIVPTPYSNAVYLSPIRNRTDYQAPEIVLLMYDRNTKEITESGESANALIGGSTLDTVSNRSNATSNVLQFTGSPESFVTFGNVGIANTLASHTVSVGSNLYIDEFGSNVLVVSGNVAVLRDMVVEGNLRVNGDTTVIYTENTSIKDALIELGKDNTSGDTTLDLGVLMHRPDALSNVVVGYREGTDEFAIAYTDAQPTDKTFTPKTDEDINVHVYGLTHVDANIYAHEDVLVTGNAYVTGNVYADKDLELAGNAYVTGNVVASKDLTLSGNAYVSGNVNVTKQLSVTGNAYVSGNVEVTKALIVSANTHLKGANTFVTNTMNFLNSKTSIVTDQVSNVQIRLGQLENVANTASNPLINQVLRYDPDNNLWSNMYPEQTLIKVKNTSGVQITKGKAVYVSGATGNNTFDIGTADATNQSKMPAIGILYQTLDPNGEGVAVTFGRANGLTGVSSFVNGEKLYVSNTVPGGLSNVKPYGQSDLIQNIGVLVNNSAGVVFVSGIGRSNDIPNAQLITDYNQMKYIYVNDINNDMKKITSANLNIPLTTAVSSSSNSAANAVTLRGVSVTSGGGFHGDLTVAGNVTVDTNTFKVDAEANRVGILTASPGQTLDVRGAANVGALTTTSASVTDTTHSTSKDTGVLVVTRGGLGVEANIHSTNVFVASHIAVGTSATTKALDVRGTSNVGVFTTPDATVTDSTAATSKTTGALKVTGGVGIQGDIHATHANLEDVEADSVTVTDSTAATSTSTGALKVTGGAGIQGDIYANDGHFTADVSVGSLSNKYIPYANASKILTDSHLRQETTGTMVIASDLEISGNLLVQGNTSIVSANNLVVSDRIIDIANNNPDHDLDIGILMEHPGHNIAIIHHPEDYLSLGYTSNGYGDTHILRDYSNEFTVNVWGYVTTQNTITIVHNDLHVESGKIGVNTTDPTADIYVVGNVHVTSNISTASNVLITGDAAATSKTTGALQVTGGAGIQGALYGAAATFDGVTSVTNSTAATGKTDGALVVTGGVGVSGALYGAAATFDGVTSVTDSTAATNKTSGALVVTGGTGISGALYGAAATFDGVTSVTNSTAATGKTDGALVVTGGVGVSGALYGAAATFDGVTSVTNSTAATGKTDGALVVTGGVGVSGALYGAAATFDGVTSVTNATAATGKTDGALVVTGGVGVSGALYGAAATFDGVTSVTNATAATGKTDGALVVTGGVGVSGDIHATHANLEDVEADSVNITDTTAATNKTTGALKVAGGVGVSGALYGAAATFDGVTSVTNATAATGKTDGALVVTGGTGISGALYGAAATFDGVTSITNATAVTGKTDGALVVTGGVGISGDIHATHCNFEDVEADSVNITDTTQATSTTTGALTVVGGISTQTNVHAANVYISGGLITNLGHGVTKKTYSYSGTIGNTEQPHINVCFTNESFNAKINAQLIEGDDEISTISFDCCGGNKSGTLSASDIQTGSIQVFGPASTNPWSSTVVTDKNTVAMKPSGAIDTSGEYHIFIEYITGKTAGAVANVVQDTTENIVFGY
jgi:cytoskeletal protein CcmA (bactofilin family)